MAKEFRGVLIFGVVLITLCQASPVKLDKIRTAKNRFLARQELAENDDNFSAQTPYPPAGIRPEIPFGLPTEEKLVAPANHYLPPSTDPAMFYSAPAEVYGPPAETYGPPEINDKNDNEINNSEDDENKVAEEETQTEVPEEAVTEQQPEEDQEATTDDEFGVEAPEAEEERRKEEIPERLVLAKSTNTIKAAKLRQFAPLTPKPVKAQQFYLINGSLYTLV